MSSIYDRGAALAARLLAPEKYGQGVIVLVRSTPGTPNPNAPWEPVTPTVTTETLKGAARGVSKELIGVEVGGTVILASDRQAICAPPSMGYTAGDTLVVDGVPVTIISVQNIPAAGVTSAVKFFIRG